MKFGFLMRTLKEKYQGKLIYVTPGAGKTTAVENNLGVIDSDELMVDAIIERHPDFKKKRGESIQNYIQRFTAIFKYKTKINNMVVRKSHELQADNYTVLTGTLKIAPKADFVFLIPPTNSRVLTRFGGIDNATNWHQEEINFLNSKNIHFEILDTEIEDCIFK